MLWKKFDLLLARLEGLISLLGWERLDGTELGTILGDVSRRFPECHFKLPTSGRRYGNLLVIYGVKPETTQIIRTIRYDRRAGKPVWMVEH